MPGPLTISVTQDHIDHGERGSQCFCPIALAVPDSRGCRPLAVTARIIMLVERDEDGGLVVNEYALPAEAIRFVAAFDSWEEVHPTSFLIEPREHAPVWF